MYNQLSRKMGLYSMAKNDSYDTFRSKNESLIMLLFCKKRTKNDAKYIKTLTVLCTMEAEKCKGRGSLQRYTDHRQLNSKVGLKIVSEKPKPEGKFNLI